MGKNLRRWAYTSAKNLELSAAFVVLVTTLIPAADAERSDLDRILSFEGSRAGAIAPGWGGGPPETLFADDKVVHGGSWAGRIERSAESPKAFSTFTASIPVDFAGTTIEFRGFLRTEGVQGWAGLWLREDDESGPFAYESMEDQPVRGSTAWAEYTVRLPIHRTVEKVFFGVILSGAGKVWVDDLRLLVDGKPVKDVPKFERPKSVLETDREFDNGSKVTIDALAPVQITNLVTLGRVWGFLKYHHPKVVSGAVHWDYELFRVVPRVIAAADQAAAQKVILDWAKALGDIPAPRFPRASRCAPTSPGSMIGRRSGSPCPGFSSTSIETGRRVARRRTSRRRRTRAIPCSAARRTSPIPFCRMWACGSWRCSGGGTSWSTGRPIAR